jgi:peptide/nickel transport system substrate-binding protein
LKCLSVFLCFCGSVYGLGCQASPKTGVVTVAVLSSPNSLDPRIGSDETSQRIHALIYDHLLALDDQLRVVGGLASSWEQTDPVTYVVHLRQGVRFHDGHELTADDVVYTFGSFIDPKFVSPRKGAYRALDRVEAIDPYTVRFVLKEPFGSFPINLVMPVVPKGAGPDLRDHPIGTGPYKFVSFAVDDHVTLTAFPDYFRGRPANDGVVLKVVPDEIMRALELRKGTVDMVVNDLSPDVIHQLAEEKSVTIAESPGTDYAYVGINMRDPVLKDRRVRSIGRQSSIICAAAWRARRSASCRRHRGRSTRTCSSSRTIRQRRWRCWKRPVTAIPTATARSRGCDCP